MPWRAAKSSARRRARWISGRLDVLELQRREPGIEPPARLQLGVLRLEPQGLLFARNIVIAFIPAAILGLLLKDAIDLMLQSPAVVAWALVVGGVAIIAIERAVEPGEDVPVAELPLRRVIGVGFAQCLAMIPGVSRSGATIMGALGMGVGRKTAAEFSFFLAVPTMLGASTLEIVDKRDQLTAGAMTVGWGEIAIGFVVSFVVAMAVIKGFVAYVSRHGFAPFGWYRILIGALAVAWLALR
jgi:undecaprenyl-diphosphatase